MIKRILFMFALAVVFSPLTKAEYGFGSEVKLQLELSWLNPDLSSPRSVSIIPERNEGGEWLQIIADINSCRILEDGVTACSTLGPFQLNVFPKVLSDKRDEGGDLKIGLASYGQLRVTSSNKQIRYYLKFKNKYKEMEVELTPKAHVSTGNSN